MAQESERNLAASDAVTRNACRTCAYRDFIVLKIGIMTDCVEYNSTNFTFVLVHVL